GRRPPTPRDRKARRGRPSGRAGWRPRRASRASRPRARAPPRERCPGCASRRGAVSASPQVDRSSLDLSRVKTDGPPDGKPHQADYLDSADAVSRWMSSIRGSKLVALDTEGASFHRFVDRIYLLQVSTRERTAV